MPDQVKSHHNRLIAAIAGVVVLIVLAIVGLRSVIKDGTIKGGFEGTPIPDIGVTQDGLTDIPDAEATPGLMVFGTVRNKSGSGLESVDIYRRYASYPGVLIATTDANGFYQSEFYAIPGDEMITIYASRSGVEFEPEYYYWRHYYGYERAECNFEVQSP